MAKKQVYTTVVATMSTTIQGCMIQFEIKNSKQEGNDKAAIQKPSKIILVDPDPDIISQYKQGEIRTITIE